jgi:hypothetical protein
MPLNLRSEVGSQSATAADWRLAIRRAGNLQTELLSGDGQAGSSEGLAVLLGRR